MNRKIYIILVIIGLVILAGVILFLRAPEQESAFTPPTENETENQVPEPGTEILSISNYYSNTERGGVDCEAVFPVTREIPRTDQVIRASLEELFKGPTPDEIREGFSNSIPINVRINSIDMEDSLLRVDFSEDLNNVAGSCAVQAVRAQITETLRQFSGVEEVEISINGRTEDILQP